MRVVDWSLMDPGQRAASLLRPALRAGPDVNARVREIISSVRRDGDTALRRLTAELDGVELKDFAVSDAEAKAAEAELPAAALEAIQVAITNVSRFHEAQLTPPIRVETSAGVVCERLSRPLGAVGLYVPAGTAPLPSTAIMLSVPSRIAGCPVRIMCTPPRQDGRADPAVVTAARACGVSRIYKLGGAQAIAAMAYGTATVDKVDKIFGPGNTWVTAAKAIVAADPGGAALDLPAGPSEVMVIADEDANAEFVALDLLSQAEHGTDSHVVLVCLSAAFAARVQAAINRALPGLPRREIIAAALRHSLAIQVPTLADSVSVANQYAPEHLIIQAGNPRQLAAGIQTAGSVFLGAWTPESVGDYCSGTNHVLPTYGYARTYSGLSVGDFQRRMTLQELSPAGLRGLAPTVTTLARLEGLEAHAAAVTVRLRQDAGGVGR